jgi:hypothetical protein
MLRRHLALPRQPGEQAIRLLGLERYGRRTQCHFRSECVSRRILIRAGGANQRRRVLPPELRGDRMDQHTGQHANEAIFAANGPSRARLLKAAGAASLAVLAAWLIALALGVWSGFELLPGLPSSHSTRPSEASSRTQHPPSPAPQSHPQSHQSTRAVRTASPSRAGGTASGTGSGSGGGSGSGTTHSQGSNPKSAAPQPDQSPSTSSTPPSTSSGTTTTTQVPADSPGSLPSGSDMPGQLP